MFTVDPDITDLKVKEKNLFQVFFSMNVHQVATPDMSLEEARSYVFFFREGRDGISAFIGLHFLHSDRKLYYRYSGNPFTQGGLADVEDEARQFAEDLGAMLDDLDFSKLSSQEKDRWIDDQEIFSARKKEQPAENPVPEHPDAAAVSPAPELTAHDHLQLSAVPASESPAAAQQTPRIPETAIPMQQPAAQAPPIQAEVSLQQAPPQPSAATAPQAAAAPVPIVAQPAEPVVAPEQKQAPAPARQADEATAAPAGKLPGGPLERANGTSAEERDAADPVRPSRVLEEAMKAGVVKAPREKLKKDIRAASGLISRDREALARLLASF